MTIDFFQKKHKSRKDYLLEPSICPYCGDRMIYKNASRDHIVAESKGGTEKMWVCRRCNHMKGDMSIEDFLEHIAKIVKNCKVVDTAQLAELLIEVNDAEEKRVLAELRQMKQEKK